MYNPAHFRETRPERLHEFLRSHPLALLVTTDLQASHIPVLLDEEAGTLRGHLARANAHWKSLHGADVLAVFSGPSQYISPSWYPSKAEHGKVVPTWNYVTVHVRGRCTVHEDPEWLRPMLHQLTDRNEASVGERWSVSDAPEDYIRGLLAAIVGIEIRIDSMEGKWKASQNRSAEDREGVAAGVRALAYKSDVSTS